MKAYYLFLASMLFNLTAVAQSCKTKSGVTIETSQAVDLGLPSGILWAGYNIGASQPDERGILFAWGEVKPKLDCSWDNYFDTLGYTFKSGQYTVSNDSGKQDFCTFYPNGGKTCISGDSFYDVAKMSWGIRWSIPTKEQYMELFDESSSYPDEYNGIFGFVVVGPNKKAIFLPSTSALIGEEALQGGQYKGRYWLGDLHSYFPDSAYSFGFNQDSKHLFQDHFYRCVGYAIRPVCKP